MKFEVNWWKGSKDIAFLRDVHSIHFKKFDGGHLVFSRWPKMYSVCLLDNMNTNFKFEVNWGSGSKDIAFTSIYYLLLHIFQKADGGHLDFSRWPKIKFSFSKTLNRPPTYRLICMYNMKWFNAAVSEKYKVCI